jgi:hypothetical protein
MIFLDCCTNFRSNIPNATAALPDFNIAAVGDWGCKTSTTSTVNNIVSKNTEITIGLGDYADMPPADCWFQIITPIEDQMYIAIGNHDAITTTLLNQYMNHFNMQEQYFSFNYQNVHFLVLSLEDRYGIRSPQYNFAQEDLQSAASDPGIDWIIVAYHRNVFSSQTLTKGLYTAFNQIYHPMFQHYDVDLVLQGHLHSYERSHPLKFNSTDPFTPIIDTSSINDYNDPDGQIFATVGTGGTSSHHSASKGRAFVTQVEDMFGFLNIDIINDGKTLRATFFGNDGLARDQFTIRKDASMSPPSLTFGWFRQSSDPRLYN